MRKSAKHDYIQPRAGLFIRVIGVVLLVTIFTLILQYAGWLKGFELAALDSWSRAWLHLNPPTRSQNIVIVNIDDQDYKDLFDDHSPLDSSGLEGIMTAIANAEPAVLCVDIDTSNATFNNMKRPQGVSVVWAWDTNTDENGKPHATSTAVLGGNQSQPTMMGIAKLPIDDDGVVRSYVRKFGTYDSFAWAITKAYCSKLGNDGGIKAQLNGSYSRLTDRCEAVKQIDKSPNTNEESALDLLGDRFAFQHLSAREILDAYQGSNKAVLDQLRGTIVLLGGTYYAARDEYSTPVGRMAGVELTADSVQSELAGGGFRRPTELLMFLLNLLGGIGILLLFVKFGLGKGCLISGLAILIVAPVWSLLAFHSVAYVVYFLPIFTAILIHQLYEQAHYYQHKVIHAIGHPSESAQASHKELPTEHAKK